MPNFLNNLLNRDEDEELDLEFDLADPESGCFELPPDREDNQVLAVWGSNANNLSIKIRFTQSKKSNRIFGRKHLTLMREFGTRSRPSLNDRYRLFQA